VVCAPLGLNITAKCKNAFLYHDVHIIQTLNSICIKLGQVGQDISCG